MKKLKLILLEIFPKPDLVGKDYYFKIKWGIISGFFAYFYIRFFIDLVTLISHKPIFEQSYDFFIFNNYVASFASLSSVAMGIALIHLVIRIQYEAPDDLSGKLIFNGFLAVLLFVVLTFKKIEIDPLIGTYVVEWHEEEFEKIFSTEYSKNEYKLFKEKLFQGKFEEGTVNYEILCDLGNVESCIVFSGIYAEEKGLMHYWSLKRAIHLDPKQARALNNISWSMLTDSEYSDSQKGIKDALGYAKEAVKLQPNNHFYNDTLAFAYYRKDDCERAQTYQFIALKYLDQDQVRNPSSVLKTDYNERLSVYKSCEKED